MSVCQAFTGSGGWPTSIFMTWEQKPFFAGTYYPKTTRGGVIGLKELLLKIHGMWEENRELLLQQPTDEYPLKDGKTTYYVCGSHSCLPPVHELKEEVFS